MDVSSRKVKKLLDLRERHGSSVTSFSVATLQKSILTIKQRLEEIKPLRALRVDGHCDRNCQHSGVFFYGIHLVSLMIEFLGCDIRNAQAVTNGPDSVVVCGYPDGLTATLNFFGDQNIPGWPVSAVGEMGGFFQDITMGKNKHLPGVTGFFKMFLTGKEPFDDARLLKPIIVLEPVAEALTNGD